MGFPPDRWRRVQQDAARLLAEHEDDLRRAGWMGKARALPEATDPFGVHPTGPGVAIHCVGLAVVIGGAQVVEVAPDHAVFPRPSGARLTQRRMPSSEAVPMWELET